MSKPPTAVHANRLRHATELRPLLCVVAVFGLGTIDHAPPFHHSINVWSTPWFWYVPTAVHALTRLHDTPDRALNSVAEAFGLGTTDHAEPFHDSIRV